MSLSRESGHFAQEANHHIEIPTNSKRALDFLRSVAARLVGKRLNQQPGESVIEPGETLPAYESAVDELLRLENKTLPLMFEKLKQLSKLVDDNIQLVHGDLDNRDLTPLANSTYKIIRAEINKIQRSIQKSTLASQKLRTYLQEVIAQNVHEPMMQLQPTVPGKKRSVDYVAATTRMAAVAPQLFIVPAALTEIAEEVQIPDTVHQDKFVQEISSILGNFEAINRIEKGLLEQLEKFGLSLPIEMEKPADTARNTNPEGPEDQPQQQESGIVQAGYEMYATPEAANSIGQTTGDETPVFVNGQVVLSPDGSLIKIQSNGVEYWTKREAIEVSNGTETAKVTIIGFNFNDARTNTVTLDLSTVSGTGSVEDLPDSANVFRLTERLGGSLRLQLDPSGNPLMNADGTEYLLLYTLGGLTVTGSTSVGNITLQTEAVPTSTQAAPTETPTSVPATPEAVPGPEAPDPEATTTAPAQTGTQEGVEVAVADPSKKNEMDRLLESQGFFIASVENNWVVEWNNEFETYTMNNRNSEGLVEVLYYVPEVGWCRLGSYLYNPEIDLRFSIFLPENQAYSFTYLSQPADITTNSELSEEAIKYVLNTIKEELFPNTPDKHIKLVALSGGMQVPDLDLKKLDYTDDFAVKKELDWVFVSLNDKKITDETYDEYDKATIAAYILYTGLIGDIFESGTSNTSTAAGVLNRVGRVSAEISNTLFTEYPLTAGNIFTIGQ